MEPESILGRDDVSRPTFCLGLGQRCVGCEKKLSEPSEVSSGEVMFDFCDFGIGAGESPERDAQREILEVQEFADKGTPDIRRESLLRLLEGCDRIQRGCEEFVGRSLEGRNDQGLLVVEVVAEQTERDISFLGHCSKTGPLDTFPNDDGSYCFENLRLCRFAAVCHSAHNRSGTDSGQRKTRDSLLSTARARPAAHLAVPTLWKICTKSQTGRSFRV